MSTLMAPPISILLPSLSLFSFNWMKRKKNAKQGKFSTQKFSFLYFLFFLFLSLLCHVLKQNRVLIIFCRRCLAVFVRLDREPLERIEPDKRNKDKNKKLSSVCLSCWIGIFFFSVFPPFSLQKATPNFECFVAFCVFFFYFCVSFSFSLFQHFLPSHPCLFS